MDFKEIANEEKLINSMLGRNLDNIPQIVVDKIIDQQKAVWIVLEKYNAEIKYQGLQIADLQKKYEILHSIYMDELEYSGNIQHKLSKTIIWARNKLKNG